MKQQSTNAIRKRAPKGSEQAKINKLAYHKQYSAGYYLRNKDMLDVRSKDYRQSHKEEIVKYRKGYYQKNKK